MIKEILIFVGGLVTGVAAATILKEERYKPIDIPFVNSGCCQLELPPERKGK